MTTRFCRTCRLPFVPYGKAYYCSPECRCGSDAGYNAGCRCEACRAAHAANHRRLRARPCPTVDATGTRRRVQALACLGWSAAELSRSLGRNRSYLAKAIDRDRVHPTTAAAVEALYDRLSMTWCTTPTAARTAATARAAGWVPPLAWDEGAIDDPTATPYGVHPTPVDGLDPVVVDRILAGEHTLPATPAERAAVAAGWRRRGRPLAELARLTGWNVHRYITPEGEAA